MEFIVIFVFTMLSGFAGWLIVSSFRNGERAVGIVVLVVWLLLWIPYLLMLGFL